MFIRIYALAVCFAAMICLTITSGIVLYDLVQFSFPKFTMDTYQYESLQTNQAYRKNHYVGRGAIMVNRPGFAPAIPNSDPSIPEMSDEEVTVLREQALRQAISNTRHNALNSLIRLAIVLLVSGVVFLFHWQLARQQESAV